MSDENEKIDPAIPHIISKLMKPSPKVWKEVKPNVQKLTVHQLTSDGKYTVALVEYEDKKEILVFRCTPEQLKENPFIEVDFTFTEHLSPIAKFPPIEAGWEDAVNYVKFIRRQ